MSQGMSAASRSYKGQKCVFPQSNQEESSPALLFIYFLALLEPFWTSDIENCE